MPASSAAPSVGHSQQQLVRLRARRDAAALVECTVPDLPPLRACTAMHLTTCHCARVDICTAFNRDRAAQGGGCSNAFNNH